MVRDMIARPQTICRGGHQYDAIADMQVDEDAQAHVQLAADHSSGCLSMGHMPQKLTARAGSKIHTHRILERSKSRLVSMRSMIRPGVPIAMSTPRRSCCFWFMMGAPAARRGISLSA